MTLPPTTTPNDLKAAREKRAAEAAEAKQQAERKKRREAEEARKANGASELVTDEDDAELLRGLSKGYKKREDGSTTTFFDRQARLTAVTAVTAVTAIEGSHAAGGGLAP